MIDWNAFRKLSYGLYLVTSRDANGHKVGCVANTFQQITSEPPQVTVTLNKQNATTRVIEETKRFAVTVLAEKATMELIGAFGFRTSYEYDKFDGVEYEISEAEIPHVRETGVARFDMEVTQAVDVGTHLIFVGSVIEAEIIDDDEPLTYAQYHAVKKGKTPPKASAYIPEDAADADELREEINDVESEMAEEVANAIEASLEKGAQETAAFDAEDQGKEPDMADKNAQPAPGKRFAWQCTVCGYIEYNYQDELPEGYTCPICGAPAKKFVRIEVDA